MSREEYDLIDAVNYSTLKEIFLRSPKHYKHALDRPHSKSSPALTRGNLIHCAVLEPDLLESRYLVKPPWLDMRTKEGKAWAAKHENDPRTIVTEDQYAKALGCSYAVRHDPVAAPLLARGAAEVTIVWQDPETGLRLKGRVDWLSDAFLVDLKTTIKLSPRDFAAQAYRLGYHIQFAMYFDGVAAQLGERPFRVITVEPEEPFDVVVYEIPEDVIEQGQIDYHDALRTLQSCQRNNTWPGIAPGIPLRFQLPRWATEHDDDDMSDLEFGDDNHAEAS
jgi:hypothetical protein